MRMMKPYPKLRLVEWVEGSKVRISFGVAGSIRVREVELPVDPKIARRVRRDGATGLTAGFPYEWSATELFVMPGKWLVR